MISLKAYRRDQRGSTAAEFGLVVPVFVALVLGVIHMSGVVYAAVQLHDATEWTARCYSVSANNPVGATTTCPDPAKVQTYARARYTGPNISPTFTRGNGVSCTNGVQVTGLGTYRMSLGIATIPFSLSAKACYPYSPPT